MGTLIIRSDTPSVAPTIGATYPIAVNSNLQTTSETKMSQNEEEQQLVTIESGAVVIILVCVLVFALTFIVALVFLYKFFFKATSKSTKLKLDDVVSISVNGNDKETKGVEEDEIFVIAPQYGDMYENKDKTKGTTTGTGIGGKFVKVTPIFD